MKEVRGGCLCGMVRLVAKGQPLRVGVCHCLDCRKHHGAVFYAAAIFDAEAVAVAGDTAQYRERHFCPTCGGSVFAVSGDECEVYLGCLDEVNVFAPEYEKFVDRRESWVCAVGEGGGAQ